MNWDFLINRLSETSWHIALLLTISATIRLLDFGARSYFSELLGGSFILVFLIMRESVPSFFIASIAKENLRA